MKSINSMRIRSKNEIIPSSEYIDLELYLLDNHKALIYTLQIDTILKQKILKFYGESNDIIVTDDSIKVLNDKINNEITIKSKLFSPDELNQLSSQIFPKNLTLFQLGQVITSNIINNRRLVVVEINTKMLFSNVNISDIKDLIGLNNIVFSASKDPIGIVEDI